MTHAVEIFDAIRVLTTSDPRATFTRNDVRQFLGISHEDWNHSYTAIFQAMRVDQPGGAPAIKEMYVGVIERIRRGEYSLTEKGRGHLAPIESLPTWRESVLGALRRYSRRHASPLITRQGLITEELPEIEATVTRYGLTPEQSLSSALQEIRDQGLLTFTGDGCYLLLDEPVLAERVELPEDALEGLVVANKLTFGDVETGDLLGLSRQRRGQAKVRRQTLINYSSECAFCSVDDEAFLVAAHVSPWSDDKLNRGNLANMICMCRLHDALFEAGYFTLTDKYEILTKPYPAKDSIGTLLGTLLHFRPPTAFPPDPMLLQKHRDRIGFLSA